MKKILLVVLLLNFSLQVFGQNGGDVIVTEILQNPSAVTDANGEWFEIYNTTGSAIDLDGWTFKDAGTDSYTVGVTLMIPANDYLVLGRNDDTGTNGGAPVDHEYSGFILGNSDDEVIIVGPAPNSLEIDRVEYDGGGSFPNPNGASMFLADLANDNNVGANWGTSTVAWPGSAGDFGTPGQPNDGALPTNLTTFTAKPMEAKTVSLEWSTAAEENNAYFSIEHSTDGRDFKTIDQVAGALNSNETQYYNYHHIDATRGMNYYRLRQVDTDGVFTFSQIAAVMLGSDAALEVRPTLAKASVQVVINQGFDKDATIEIYNILGSLVISEVLERGATQTAININKLQKGHYFLKLTNGSESQVSRFIKQ
ncbi:MAG: hypothetical protein ACI8VT_003847 [Saprospiraceae bacterium]|jgi:hypothetical protein